MMQRNGAPIGDQRQYSGKYYLSMPDPCSSVLLDNLWEQDAFEAAFQSQVVPDAIELDLSDVAAGLHQHMHADGLPDTEHWTPGPEYSAEFSDILRQPSSSAHALSSLDEVDEAVDSFASALFGQQDLHPAGKAAAAAAQHKLPADPSQQQQQQQQVPDMQWVPTPQQQPAAATGFTWPCPEELRKPLNTSNLTAAHMVPMVFPATPAAAAAAAAPAALASIDSSCFSSDAAAGSCREPVAPAAASLFAAVPAAAALEQPDRYSATASAGSGTAADNTAAAPVAPLRQQHVSSAAAVAVADWAKQLGPAVRSRAEAVARYRAKRARRSTVKRVRYQRRKDYADKRPRVGGRFVKLTDLQQH